MFVHLIATQLSLSLMTEEITTLGGRTAHTHLTSAIGTVKIYPKPQS